MESLLALADRAFVDEEFSTAVKFYSEALSQAPTPALQSRIYEARANALIKTDDFLEAANDAAKSIELDPGNAKAYLRRGMALFNLDEFEAAKEAFEGGSHLDSGNVQWKKWIRKCQAEIDEEDTTPATRTGEGSMSAPATSATLSSLPVPVPVPGALSDPGPTRPLAPAAAVPERKYRHQYYQLQNKVSVDIYAKGISTEAVAFDFQETHLKLTIKDNQGGEDYVLDVDLYGKVVPSQCKVEVLKSKIEVTMTKAENVQWGSLEKSNKIAAPNYSTPGTTAPSKYPSSYAKAPKDWDKVESEISELEKKGDLDDGDPLNGFFKKIFSQGDEDTRRAMMKSFVESNGTVLSTNWKDVGSKKVDCTPPDGMVLNKFEQ